MRSATPTVSPFIVTAEAVTKGQEESHRGVAFGSFRKARLLRVCLSVRILAALARAGQSVDRPCLLTLALGHSFIIMPQHALVAHLSKPPKTKRGRTRQFMGVSWSPTAPDNQTSTQQSSSSGIGTVTAATGTPSCVDTSYLRAKHDDGSTTD